MGVGGDWWEFGVYIIPCFVVVWELGWDGVWLGWDILGTTVLCVLYRSTGEKIHHPTRFGFEVDQKLTKS